MCLDDAAPDNIAELCANFLCGTYSLTNGAQVGTCTNRWYDKVPISPLSPKPSITFPPSYNSLSVQMALLASTSSTQVLTATPCSGSRPIFSQKASCSLHVQSTQQRLRCSRRNFLPTLNRTSRREELPVLHHHLRITELILLPRNLSGLSLRRFVREFASLKRG